MEIINLKMMMHPMNWLIVWIVLLIASFAFKEIHNGVTNAGAGSQIPD
jgi:hypothetical protein